MYQTLFSTLLDQLENFRLRLHFSYVLLRLRHGDANRSRASAVHSRRLAMIERIDHYRNNNIFPRNTEGGAAKPYFFDAEQRACAVADLLIYSDKTELADEISAWDNNARVKDMHFPELLLWAKKNGLSKQDLMLIQPQYPELSLQGLPILILSCANLLLLLLYGRRSIKNTLLGAGTAWLLFYAMQFFF